MKAFIFVCVAMSAMVSHGVNEGLKAVVERRQNMKRVERPVAQRMDNGNILSVYEDGRVTTQAVRMVRMSKATTDAVVAKMEEKETLKAAKALVVKIKAKHGKKVEGLSDSEIVSASESVFDTSDKDSGAAGVIGVLLGAAVGKIAEKKKLKEENGNGKAR